MGDEVNRERKLAVMLHADIVGSTALVHRDETIAHARITDAFTRFSALVIAYGGTVREIRGDALVAEFARASDAISSALAAQAANEAHNTMLDDDIRPEMRVGIALGEVVIADATVTGPGIVLAQRLEQFAEAGGVCVQGSIYEAVPGRMPFEYTNLGERELKGFDEPVRAFAVSLVPGQVLPQMPRQRGLTAAPRRNRIRQIVGLSILVVLAAVSLAVFWSPNAWHEALPERFEDPSSAVVAAATDVPPTPALARVVLDAALPEANSIAVLPFTNMSDDSTQEYFSDGLTEDIITDLARISSLLVIARNSSFVYKGRAVDVKTVGGELGVRYILEGSVRRSGDRVRITAQLIDVGSGMHVWANRYDRNITDVFAVQDELTRTIVDALEVQLTAEEASALAETEDVGIDAYDTLLRGNEVMARFTGAAMVEARVIYERAVRLNPRYARAHANIAFTHAQEALFGWSEDVDASIRLGFEAAEEAKQLDPNIPQLHLTLSNLHGAKLDWEESARVAYKTIKLEPSYADGFVVLSVALTFLGDLEGAWAAIQRAKRINPYYSFIYLWVEARIAYLNERYEEAAALLEDAVQRNPDFDQVRIMLAATYAQLGRTDDALWETEEIMARRPDFTIASDVRVRGFRDPALLERYVDGLRKAGLPE